MSKNLTGGESDLSGADHASEFQDIIMEEGDEARQLYREAAKTAWGFVRRALVYINGLTNKPLAFDCWLFVCEEFELLGCDKETDLAKRHRCTKANVSQTVKEIQRNFGMQAFLRSDSGVNNMREKRKGQLK